MTATRGIVRPTPSEARPTALPDRTAFMPAEASVIVKVVAAIALPRRKHQPTRPWRVICW